MTSPTRKQRELLTFIDTFIKSNGYGPSYREIMRAFDYESVSTVAAHVNGLIVRGFLVKKDNSARSLQVVPPTQSAADVVVAPVEQVIRAKISALEQQDNAADDIAVLRRALEILQSDQSS